MEKIKLITDSACDIPVEDEKRLGITILPIPITIGTEGYYERESFNFDQFYDIVEAAEEIPATSHILSITYQEEYEKALAQGYTHVIVVTIYSGASNMNFAAHAAISAFYEEYPEAKEKITIEVLDSRTFTMGYGYPLIQAAEKIQAGVSFNEIVAFLKDQFDHTHVYFSPFTLKYVKKSGRVSCAAAFVGELIGLRPVISMNGGPSQTVAKVRGNGAVVSQMVSLFQKYAREKTPYIVLRAKTTQYPDELAKQMEDTVGYPPVGIYKIGAAITINTGPDIVGIVFLGK